MYLEAAFCSSTFLTWSQHIVNLAVGDSQFIPMKCGPNTSRLIIRRMDDVGYLHFSHLICLVFWSFSRPFEAWDMVSYRQQLRLHRWQGGAPKGPGGDQKPCGFLQGLMLLGLLGIIMAHLAHSRDTYQPTSIMRWNRGNHDNLIYWGLSVTVSVIMIHYGNSYQQTRIIMTEQRCGFWTLLHWTWVTVS